MSDAPFDAQNAGYAQLLYEQFARNPDSVPEAWRTFFARGPETAAAHGLLVPEGLVENDHGSGGSATAVREVVEVDRSEETARLLRLLPAVSRATWFLQAYRDHGHMLAEIDPLGSAPTGHPQLDPEFFGTSFEELEEIPANVVIPDAPKGERLTAMIHRFRKAYAGHIGYEFEHIEDPEKVRWLWDQVETGAFSAPPSKDEAVRVLRRLSFVEGLEQFLHRAYLGQKRFSIEGTDMLVPMIDMAIEETARMGGRKVVIGMAHRGRLNVLAHILGVSYKELLRAFEGLPPRGPLNVAGTGDVKYHHGAEGAYELANGEEIDVVLAPNPSHLEFVNPVVSGMARAWQFASAAASEEQDLSAVVPIMVHGDAAFAAEGVVAETLNMARLPGYAVGGAIHIIANNQIGFTTTPREGRSTRYSSDLAKGYDFPILHVNADEPDACLAAMRLAMAYRDAYHDDVVIDLVGYRRHGHNEGDEPAYTQPVLYEKIANHPTVRTLWVKRMVDEGFITQEEADQMEEEVVNVFRAAQDAVKSEGEGDAEEPTLRAAEFDDEVVDPETAVPLDRLEAINLATVTFPDGFNVHPKLLRQLNKRKDDFSTETRLDWAYAEALAFGSILEDGMVVRLTGQDSQRGTFSQRHLVLHDAEDGEIYTPLAAFGEGRLEIFNSPLTESAVMGFEYGYSVASKADLTLWEGQFGDFVNVAQVAIDQFISSGREKWGQVSNLTLLLPHGFEGQGPEHSSARLERFLQLCAEDNMRVVYPTTPAQYFHMLRRQAMARPERPLIVMTPKSLLRLPAASSTVEELANGSFRPVLDDPNVGDDRRNEITRLVLCSGKVYYDVQGADRRAEAPHVAVARLEEFYPFPKSDLEALMASYPKLKEVVWLQEEPRNMGGLTFVGPRLRAATPRTIPLRHVGRPDRASPAEGKAKDHLMQQNRIIIEALGLEPSEG